MLRRVRYLSLILMLLSSSAVLADEPVPLQSIGDRDGNMYDYAVELTRLAAAPTWDPAKSESPLPTAKATSAALEWIVAKSRLEPSEFTLEAIKYQRVPRQDPAGHWFCQVEYVEGWGDIARHRIWTVVLLMDGAVIEPTLRGEP